MKRMKCKKCTITDTNCNVVHTLHREDHHLWLHRSLYCNQYRKRHQLQIPPFHLRIKIRSSRNCSSNNNSSKQLTLTNVGTIIDNIAVLVIMIKMPFLLMSAITIIIIGKYKNLKSYNVNKVLMLFQKMLKTTTK